MGKKATPITTIATLVFEPVKNYEKAVKCL